MSRTEEHIAHLAIDRVCLEIGDVQIISAATLTVGEGTIVGLLGPNGSGKSTLIRALYKSIPIAQGAVLIDGTSVAALSNRDVARRIAIVSQEHPTDFDFTVADVVQMGRTPHLRPFERLTSIDRQVVAQAIARTGLVDLEDRVFSTLSGGEKQRCLIARALAQGTRLLLLDEPTNHLDLRAQFELLALVKNLGITVVIAIHDLNLAARFCDEVHILHRGRVRFSGPTSFVLRPDVLADIFGVVTRCETHPETGKLNIVVIEPTHEVPDHEVRLP